MVIANTLFQQHKRRLYTQTSPDGQHRNQIDYILCSQRWRSSIQSAKTRPGADCGSDHELLITKFRLKLKKVGKTTRTFRYDLNEYSGLIFRMDWLDLLAGQGTLKSLLQHHFFANSSTLSFLHGPTLTSIHDHWKNHSFD